MKKFTLKKLLICLLSCLMILLVACTPTTDDGGDEGTAQEVESEMSDDDMADPESRGEITLAKATWDTGWFQAAVFQTLLTDLGYEVDDIGTLDNSAFYISAAQGDIDMWANGWFPIHDEYLKDDKVTGKVEKVGYQVEAGGLQGYLVDMKSAEEFGITSLADFTDPDVVANFDSDGDGMAELIGCDAGWGCELVINDTLAELELSETVEQVQGAYSALMADTIGKYKRGEPVLFYTWTPNWTVSQLKLGEDVVWIEAPIAESSEKAVTIPNCTVDPCNMGFDAADIRVVANSEFVNSHPDVKALLEAVVIPLSDIANQNQLMVDGADSDEEIAGHAADWIADNRETIDGWLELARAEQ